jgi:epoxyqueuosine reductase
MEALPARLAAHGYRAQIVAIHRLRDLQADLEACLDGDLPDLEVYQEQLSELSFSPPAGLPEARSIMIVAVPQPRTRFTFAWHGRQLVVDVPPIYLHWRAAEQHVHDLLSAILSPSGFRLVPATLPEKLLIVRSGLGAYGRNAISYVPGLGSFFRPTALYTDAPCPADSWHDLRLLARCEKCTACQGSCPSGAIAADRRRLRAGRCLTLHNERPAGIPFPSWLDPTWHNCLVGCLHCQRVCPENRAVWPWVVEGATFSEEDTALLREGVPPDQLPAPAAEKLTQSDLVDLLDVLPRNLSALLDRAGSSQC